MTCNHMLGVTYCNDGEMLLMYGPDKWWKEQPPSKRDKVFKFCPFCGADLPQPPREEHS